MDKLKPCPFCGGEPMQMTSTDGFTSIGCLKCNPVFGVMTQAGSEAEAIAAWNTRAERTCRMSIDDYGVCKCDKCGWYDYWNSHEDPNYCPVCGARVVSE